MKKSYGTELFFVLFIYFGRGNIHVEEQVLFLVFVFPLSLYFFSPVPPSLKVSEKEDDYYLFAFSICVFFFQISLSLAFDLSLKNLSTSYCCFCADDGCFEINTAQFF